LDLDARALFKEMTPTIQPMQWRSFHLHDQRVVKSYYEHLRKEIEYHNLASKIDDLHKVAGNKTLNPNVEPDFEKLDKLLTEAMIYAESKCKRQFSTKY
jgi:hypothetical protein